MVAIEKCLVSKEPLVIRIGFSVRFTIWMDAKGFFCDSPSPLDDFESFFVTVKAHWMVVKDLHDHPPDSGWSLKGFHHHPAVFCKYLHRIWMVTKNLWQPF